MRLWRAGALLAGALTFGLLAGVGLRSVQPDTAHAQAAQTWDVTVGTDIEASATVMQAYFPSVVTIVQGDTVHWTFASFHTVTFTANGPPPALVVPGPTPGTLMLGPGFFPIPPAMEPPSGPYDGSTLISSGTPPDTGDTDPTEAPAFVFSLTFTAPGTFGYLCALHPGMAGTVVVLPSGSRSPETPAIAKARGQGELQGRAATLDAFVGMAARAQDVHASSGSVESHTVSAGMAVDGASKLAFLPDNVTVKAGDIVTFYWPDTYEIHTVTFHPGLPNPEFAVPGEGEGPAPGLPQLVIPANVAGPSGSTTYSGGYLNSGILGQGSSFSVTFTAPGSYDFMCVIHPFMKGTITVQ